MIVMVTFDSQQNSKCGKFRFENLKHSQNPGHLSLTEPSMSKILLILISILLVSVEIKRNIKVL